MTQVTVGENEGIESALRRFKRQVSKAGIFADLKSLDTMKLQLKNIRENYSKEERLEEGKKTIELIKIKRFEIVKILYPL